MGTEEIIALIVAILLIVYMVLLTWDDLSIDKSTLATLESLNKELLDSLYKKGITDVNLDYDICGYKAISYYNTNTDNWCIITADKTNNPHVVIKHKDLETARQLFVEAMKYGNKIKEVI